MEDKSERIKAARSILASELQKKKLRSIKLSIVDREWLKIHLLKEGRTLWLGYRLGLGYFVSWNKNEAPNNYFNLNNDPISNILDLLPSSAIDRGIGQDTVGLVRELLDSINEHEPDPEKIKRIIDEVPSTEEGIDMLAIVASIKSYRRAIKRLRDLIESQDELEHLEKEYQNILASNPWMLGSQYTELLVKEFWIDTTDRVDLMLASAVGHVDVVELKKPNTKILVPGSKANTWRTHYKLSDAQAQARKYLQILDENRLQIENKHPFAKQSVPRLYRSGAIIVAGRTPKEREALNALRDINVSEPRILILTYDDVLAIAEATIKIFERKLQSSPKLLVKS